MAEHDTQENFIELRLDSSRPGTPVDEATSLPASGESELRVKVEPPDDVSEGTKKIHGDKESSEFSCGVLDQFRIRRSSVESRECRLPQLLETSHESPVPCDRSATPCDSEHDQNSILLRRLRQPIDCYGVNEVRADVRDEYLQGKEKQLHETGDVRQQTPDQIHHLDAAEGTSGPAETSGQIPTGGFSTAAGVPRNSLQNMHKYLHQTSTGYIQHCTRWMSQRSVLIVSIRHYSFFAVMRGAMAFLPADCVHDTLVCDFPDLAVSPVGTTVFTDREVMLLQSLCGSLRSRYAVPYADVIRSFSLKQSPVASGWVLLNSVVLPYVRNSREGGERHLPFLLTRLFLRFSQESATRLANKIEIDTLMEMLTKAMGKTTMKNFDLSKDPRLVPETFLHMWHQKFRGGRMDVRELPAFTPWTKGPSALPPPPPYPDPRFLRPGNHHQYHPGQTDKRMQQACFAKTSKWASNARASAPGYMPPGQIINQKCQNRFNPQLGPRMHTRQTPPPCHQANLQTTPHNMYASNEVQRLINSPMPVLNSISHPYHNGVSSLMTPRHEVSSPLAQFQRSKSPLLPRNIGSPPPTRYNAGSPREFDNAIYMSRSHQDTAAAPIGPKVIVIEPEEPYHSVRPAPMEGQNMGSPPVPLTNVERPLVPQYNTSSFLMPHQTSHSAPTSHQSMTSFPAQCCSTYSVSTPHPSPGAFPFSHTSGLCPKSPNEGPKDVNHNITACTDTQKGIVKAELVAKFRGRSQQCNIPDISHVRESVMASPPSCAAGPDIYREKLASAAGCKRKSGAVKRRRRTSCSGLDNGTVTPVKCVLNVTSLTGVDPGKRKRKVVSKRHTKGKENERALKSSQEIFDANSVEKDGAGGLTHWSVIGSVIVREVDETSPGKTRADEALIGDAVLGEERDVPVREALIGDAAQGAERDALVSEALTGDGVQGDKRSGSVNEALTDDGVHKQKRKVIGNDAEEKRDISEKDAVLGEMRNIAVTDVPFGDAPLGANQHGSVRKAPNRHAILVEKRSVSVTDNATESSDGQEGCPEATGTSLDQITKVGETSVERLEENRVEGDDQRWIEDMAVDGATEGRVQSGGQLLEDEPCRDVCGSTNRAGNVDSAVAASGEQSPSVREQTRTKNVKLNVIGTFFRQSSMESNGSDDTIVYGNALDDPSRIRSASPALHLSGQSKSSESSHQVRVADFINDVIRTTFEDVTLAEQVRVKAEKDELSPRKSVVVTFNDSSTSRNRPRGQAYSADARKKSKSGSKSRKIYENNNNVIESFAEGRCKSFHPLKSIVKGLACVGFDDLRDFHPDVICKMKNGGAKKPTNKKLDFAPVRGGGKKGEKGKKPKPKVKQNNEEKSERVIVKARRRLKKDAPSKKGTVKLKWKKPLKCHVERACSSKGAAAIFANFQKKHPLIDFTKHLRVSIPRDRRIDALVNVMK